MAGDTLMSTSHALCRVIRIKKHAPPRAEIKQQQQQNTEPFLVIETPKFQASFRCFSNRLSIQTSLRLGTDEIGHAPKSSCGPAVEVQQHGGCAHHHSLQLRPGRPAQGLVSLAYTTSHSFIYSFACLFRIA